MAIALLLLLTPWVVGGVHVGYKHFHKHDAVSESRRGPWIGTSGAAANAARSAVAEDTLCAEGADEKPWSGRDVNNCARPATASSARARVSRAPSTRTSPSPR